MQGGSSRKQEILSVFDDGLEGDEIRCRSSEVPHFSETNPIPDAEVTYCLTEKFHIFSAEKILIWVLSEIIPKNDLLLEGSLYGQDCEL